MKNCISGLSVLLILCSSDVFAAHAGEADGGAPQFVGCGQNLDPYVAERDRDAMLQKFFEEFQEVNKKGDEVDAVVHYQLSVVTAVRIWQLALRAANEAAGPEAVAAAGARVMLAIRPALTSTAGVIVAINAAKKCRRVWAVQLDALESAYFAVDKALFEQNAGKMAYDSALLSLLDGLKDTCSVIRIAALTAGLRKDPVLFMEWPPVANNIKGFAPFLLVIMKVHLATAQSEAYVNDDKEEQIAYANRLIAELEKL